MIRRDYPVAQGLSLLLTLAVLWANLLANIGYAVVDPRIRKRCAWPRPTLVVAESDLPVGRSRTQAAAASGGASPRTRSRSPA